MSAGMPSACCLAGRCVWKCRRVCPQRSPRNEAAPHERLTVCVPAGEKANVRGDEVPLVIGCGPVGLAVIAALKLKGLHPIVAADYSSARRALGARLGAGL